MKTITLFTLGTETDVHYLLALGTRLLQQGLMVSLAAPPAFQPLACKVGVSFEALAGVEEGKYPPSASISQPAPAFFQNIRRMAETSSLMVVHRPYLPIIRALGPLPCPVMGVALQAEETFSHLTKKEGLLQRFASWISRKRNRAIQPSIPTLYNFSPQLLAGQEEQAGNIHLCGQWAIPDNLQWKLSGRAPSTELSDWLYRGGRPVFFDFSQAPESDKRYLLNMVDELSETIGFRAILCTSWAGLEEGILQRDIFHVKSPVQEWLFQQCAAVIHYRQSSRLSAAIRAGIPSILCASGTVADKWGAILAKNGIGIQLSKEPTTATRLESALQEALRLSMQYKARMMGKAIQEENGLQYATEAIGEQIGRGQVAVAV